MGRAHSDLQALGAEVIVVGTGRPQQARDYKRRLGLPYPVLADPDGNAYERFEIRRWAFGLLRQSAIFVLDLQGRIIYGRIVSNPGKVLALDDVRDSLGDSALSRAQRDGGAELKAPDR